MDQMMKQTDKFDRVILTNKFEMPTDMTGPMLPLNTGACSLTNSTLLTPHLTTKLAGSIPSEVPNQRGLTFSIRLTPRPLLWMHQLSTLNPLYLVLL